MTDEKESLGEPLFRLDLGKNGGLLAPRTIEELATWIRKEQEFWSWTRPGYSGLNLGSHHQSLSYLDTALQDLQRAEQGGNHHQQSIDSAKALIENAYTLYHLPHSSSLVGGVSPRTAAMRETKQRRSSWRLPRRPKRDSRSSRGRSSSGGESSRALLTDSRLTKPARHARKRMKRRLKMSTCEPMRLSSKKPSL